VAAVFLLVAIGAGIAANVAFDQRAAAVAARVQAEQEKGKRRSDRIARTSCYPDVCY
jgi:hypothetical protein